jgi:hypothetical protein
MKRRIGSLLLVVMVGLLTAVSGGAVSADSGSLFPRRVCTVASIGFPTCFVQQPDGLWAREELPDREMPWVVVSHVTIDDVAAAVGNVNALAPQEAHR